MPHPALTLVRSLPAILHAASPSPSPSPTVKEPDPDTVSPGLIGLLFLVLLAIAVFFLSRSLITQIKRVDFDEAAVTARMRGETVDGPGPVSPADAGGVELEPTSDPSPGPGPAPHVPDP